MTHVVLVAIQVGTESWTEAQEQVMWLLKDVVHDEESEVNIECWWIAEDDRFDGSDNDSAVFVHKGMKKIAYNTLEKLGITGPWNLPSARGKE